MRRDRRDVAIRVLLAVGVPLFVVALALVILAVTPWGNERVRRVALGQANGRMQGAITVESVRGNLFRAATLTNVQVTDSAKRVLFSARHVRVRYAILPALRGQLVLRSATLDTAVLMLEKQPGTRWNFQSLLKPRPPRDTTLHRAGPELADITIHHGRFLYRRPWIPDSTLSLPAREAAIAKVLSPDARRRTESVPGGYQRVLDYHDIDARISAIELATVARPLAVHIDALSMLAEPYRPPAIDVRSLVGTLYGTRDSLWWRGAHMIMPESRVSGDGTIGFHHSGFRLDLVGTPVAFADLRWLDPAFVDSGGGHVHYQMRLHGDTAEYAVDSTDVRYGRATLVGRAAIARVKIGDRPPEILVRDADLSFSQLSTALLRRLVPALKFRRDGIAAGTIAAHGDASALALNADVRFDDDAGGPSRIIARGEIGFSHGLRSRDLDLRLLPVQVATIKGMGVHLPIDGTVRGQALLTGNVHDGWTFRGDLTHSDRTGVSHVMGNGRYLAPGRRVSVDATLEPLSLATAGRFAPSAELRGNVTGRIHAEGTRGNLLVSGRVHSTSGGSAEGRGTLALGGARTRYDIAVAVDALDAGAFTRRAPRTALTGSILARGSGLKPATLNTALTADLVRSRYDTFALDRLTARVSAANGLLRIDTLAAANRGARATAVGTLGLVRAQRGSLTFALVVDSLGALRQWIGTTDSTSILPASRRQSARLAAARADSSRRAELVRIERLALGLPEGVSLVHDSLQPLRRDSLAGALRAAGVLRGSIAELGVDAVVRGSGLVARGASVQRLLANLQSDDLRNKAVPLLFTIDADTAQAAGQSFERAFAHGTWEANQVTAEVRLRQDDRVAYSAAGRYARKPEDQALRLDSLRATFDTLVWRLAHPAGVRLVNGSITVDSIDLRSSTGGRLFADGTLPCAGAVRLNVAAENVRVSTVLEALQRDADADGVLAASARIEGTRAEPVIGAELTLRDATYKQVRAPDVDARGRYGVRRAVLDALARDSSGRRVLVGTASLPFDLALVSTSRPRRAEGALVVDLALDSLAIATLPMTTLMVEEVRGMVAGDARARGTWAHPTYTGHLALRDGGFRIPTEQSGMRVTDLIADFRLTTDTLFADSLVGRARGPMRAFGTVDLRDRAHPFVRFTATGRDARIYDSPRGLVDADADAVAVGPLDSIRVTGRGEMKGGFLALKQFRKDLLRVKAPGDLAFMNVYDTTTSTSDSVRAALARSRRKRVGVIADLSLTVDRENYYRNRPDANTEYYTVEGEEVRAHIDTRSEDTWAVGFVRIGHGVAFFRTRTFVPSRGSLTFMPHTGAPGLVQQVGERYVWEPGRGLFPLQLLTGGTSIGPSVGLESGTLFPMRGRELNGYLTLGRLGLSLLQQSGTSLSGSEALSGQLSSETGALARRQQGATALGVVLHDIGTGTTKEYGLDAFSVSPADVPTELVFGKTGGVRGALVEGGRYLNTELYVAGQLRSTSGIPGVRIVRQFGTGYRLDAGIEPRYLFRGTDDLGITHPTERAGAFGAFLTRMWGF